MPSQVTLTGGAFQDPHGNPVALGNLVLTLSQDGLVTGTGQIAPITVVFPLDSSGNLVSSPTPSVWGNDNITPTGTFYTAEVLNAGGSRVWGPEIWTLTGAGPINVGTIPPTTKSGGITVNLPTLQTNGSNNTSQSLLNLANGANIAVTNSGGTDTIALSGNIPVTNLNSGTGASSSTFWRGDATWAAAGGSFATAGNGGFFGPGLIGLCGWNFNNAVTVVNTNNEVRVCQFALDAAWTIRNVTIRITGGSNGKTGIFGIYTANGNTLLVNSGTFTISANPQTLTNPITAVVLQPGIYMFAQSSNDNTNFNTVGINLAASQVDVFNANANRIGVAANAVSGGALPATLGAITPATDATTNITTFIAAPFFEP